MDNAAEYKRKLVAPDVAPHLGPCSLFESGFDRTPGQADASRPAVGYVPNYFSQIPRLLEEYLAVDAFLVTVSSMDKAGFFTLGTNNDYGSTAARRAKRLLVEVNERMPRVFGDSLLHVSQVDAIVEHSAPIVEVPPRTPRPEDETIGRAIAQLVPDAATLQLGIGGIPAAVARSLQGHRDLGIHTELFNDAMIDLMEAGVVTGAKKTLHRGKHVYTNAMGTQRLYDFIHDNPGIESYPVAHTSDPAVVAQNDNFISINSILEVDLTGQCNAESLDGSSAAAPAVRSTSCAARSSRAAASRSWRSTRPPNCTGWCERRSDSGEAHEPRDASANALPIVTRGPGRGRSRPRVQPRARRQRPRGPAARLGQRPCASRPPIAR